MQRPYGTNYAWVCLCRKQASATTIKLALQNCTWTVTQTHTHLKKFARFKSQKSPRTHTLNKAYYNNSVTATEGRYTHTHTHKKTCFSFIWRTWAREMSTSQRRRSVLPAADRRGKHLQNNHDNTLKTCPESKNIKQAFMLFPALL